MNIASALWYARIVDRDRPVDRNDTVQSPGLDQDDGEQLRQNLRNRFEESYGDAVNLRGRYPMAALGFLYAVRDNIPDADHAFLVDMLDKLREPAGYDATCLVVVRCEGNGPVELTEDRMPERLSPARFLHDLIDAVLHRTPADTHPRVRQLLAEGVAGRELP